MADRRRLIGEALAALIADREGFTVTGAVSADDPAQAIGEQRPDVIVVSAGADSRAALELVRNLRRQPRG